jgi:hypothetical protein
MPPAIEPVDNDAAMVTNTPQTLAPTTQAAAPSDAALTPSQSPSTAPQPAQMTQTTSMQATAATSPSQVTQGAQQPSQPSQAMVTNTPPSSASNPHANNPLVQRASIFHSAAEALTGGPQYRVTIDPTTGVTTRTPVTVSSKQLGLALALEALSGGLAGLSARRPNAKGEAAAIGLQQGQQIAQQRQQAQQQQDAQANADAKNRNDAYQRAAAVADLNARTLLSTAEAEGRGADTLSKIAATNAPLIAAYEDEGVLESRNVTQQELIDGMKAGRYNSTEQLGPIDGYRLLGNGRVEATHAVIHDPAARVPLTQAMWDDFAANHVRGFPKGTKIGDGVTVPGIQIARANEQKTMFLLAQQRHDEVSQALAQSDDPKVKALASQIPSIGDLLDDPKTSPGLTTALTRFQSYVSHADISHGGRDLYESLQAMAAPSKPDPDNKGQFIPNRDAPFAQQVAAAFSPDGSPQSGWRILKTYHNEVVPEQIANEAQAADMLASSDPGSRAAKYAQRWIQSNTQQKAGIAKAEEQARQSVKPTPANLTAPDAFGNVPTVTDAKEASKRFASFKKNLDSLSQTEQTYNQFQTIANDVAAGKLTGPESVVALLSAVGISAAPLKGNGFRISKDILAEHKDARGWEQQVQQKFLAAKDGDVITPQQILDYSNIAANARTSQYVNLANQMRSAGLSVDPALPSGNGRKLDANTANIFFTLAGGDANKARQAASVKGWVF